MMIILGYVAFAVYLAIITAGSLAAVLCSNLVRAFVGLVATFLGVAGMYLLLQSPFLAFMQLLIYIGAICILIFFALMLVHPKEEEEPIKIGKNIRSVVAGLAPLLLLTPPIFMHPASTELIPANVSVADIGKALMEDYLVPFELISIILLVSMAGGVLLAWDRRKK